MGRLRLGHGLTIPDLAGGASRPINTVAPIVTGFAIQGATLTVTTGTWVNPSNPTLTVQWQADSIDIAGATSTTFLVTGSQAGKVIRARVTANGITTVSSNSTETVFTASRFYDFSDISTLFKDSAGTTPVTTDGDVIRLVRDKSGSSADLTNTVSDATAPIYRTGSGLKWAEFTAANSTLLTMGSSLFSIVQDMAEVCGVGRTATGINVCGLMSSGNFPHCVWWFTDNKMYSALGGSESAGTTADTGTGNFVLSSQRDVSNEIIRKNKSQVGTRAAPSVTGQLSRCGGTTVSFMSMKLFGIIIAPSITAAQLAALETYMGTLAGLSI